MARWTRMDYNLWFPILAISISLVSLLLCSLNGTERCDGNVFVCGSHFYDLLVILAPIQLFWHLLSLKALLMTSKLCMSLCLSLLYVRTLWQFFRWDFLALNSLSCPMLWAFVCNNISHNSCSLSVFEGFIWHLLSLKTLLRWLTIICYRSVCLA